MVLVEFASVVDAVQRAAEIQHGMAERYAGIPPERRIEFRIGINLGDIIVEDDDIYGDGVNVAARLEALAEPAASSFRELPSTRSMGRWRSVSGSLASNGSKTSPSLSGCTGYGLRTAGLSG